MNPNIYYNLNQPTANAHTNTNTNTNINIQSLGNFPDWQTLLVPFDAVVTPFPAKYGCMSPEQREYCINEFAEFKLNMANRRHWWHSKRGLISRGTKATWRSLPYSQLRFHWDTRVGAGYSCYFNQHDVVIMHVFDDYLSLEDHGRCMGRARAVRGQLAEMLARQLGDALDLIVPDARGSNSSSEISLVARLNGMTVD